MSVKLESPIEFLKNEIQKLENKKKCIDGAKGHTMLADSDIDDVVKGFELGIEKFRVALAILEGTSVPISQIEHNVNRLLSSLKDASYESIKEVLEGVLGDIVVIKVK